MSHNGIDLDQYILLIIYPSIAFFAIGFISKKIDLRKTITYALQAIICFGFSIGYLFSLLCGESACKLCDCIFVHVFYL